MPDFDPYHRWLGIPKGQRPPTFYQLLGVAPDEADTEVIEEAALRQTSHVRLYQTGPYAQQCTAILNELWKGSQIDQGRMRNILALFALQFEDPAAMRSDIAGRTVYLALSCEDEVVRMKPQNLLLNLPLHEA